MGHRSSREGCARRADRPHTAHMRQTRNQLLVCGQSRPSAMTHVGHVLGAAAGLQHPRWESSVRSRGPCRKPSAVRAAEAGAAPVSRTRTWKVRLSKSPQPGGDRAHLGQGTVPQDPTPGDRQLLWPRVQPTWRGLCPVVEMGESTDSTTAFLTRRRCARTARVLMKLDDFHLPCEGQGRTGHRGQQLGQQQSETDSSRPVACMAQPTLQPQKSPTRYILPAAGADGRTTWQAGGRGPSSGCGRGGALVPFQPPTEAAEPLEA